MDGAVATLLSRSFDLYNIDDSDLDYPYSDNTGVFVNPDFHKKLQEEAIVSDEVEPEAENQGRSVLEAKSIQRSLRLQWQKLKLQLTRKVLLIKIREVLLMPPSI